jgi:hypothetical protein
VRKKPVAADVSPFVANMEENHSSHRASNRRLFAVVLAVLLSPILLLFLAVAERALLGSNTLYAFLKDFVPTELLDWLLKAARRLLPI